MGQRDIAVAVDAGLQLLQDASRIVAGWYLELSDLGTQVPDRRPDGQGMGAESNGVAELPAECLRRFRFQLVEHPATDRRGELFERIAEDARAQGRALGEVEKHVSREVADLQPAVGVVSLLEAADHLHHLHGVLDGDALARSLEEIAVRHEILRSRFELRDGEPVVRLAEKPPPMARIDLRQMPAEEQELTVQRLAREDAKKPFDLAAGPLFRATLIALGRPDIEGAKYASGLSI